MVLFLLAIIYLSFISLGLPDSVLGSAWPSIYPDINAPVSYAGILGMIISGGTILSSLFSGKIIKVFGTGKLVAASTALTMLALFGFSWATEVYQLCLWSIPFGLGAGGVDAALNNYVALNYKSKHMNWLHCFWGVGATIGPLIMGLSLTNNLGWRTGYSIIAVIQLILTIGLVVTVPIWKKCEIKIASDKALNIKEEIKAQQKGNVLEIKNDKQEVIIAQKIDEANVGMFSALKLRGVASTLIGFLCYCALETTAGAWAGTYMVLVRDIDIEVAARWTAIFYLGITLGRFLSGFISEYLGGKSMIRAGLTIVFLGILVLALPLNKEAVVIALGLIGLGCAPIYPSIIHDTPKKFGKQNSQALIGIQMASAYTGSTFISPLFGAISAQTTLKIYPAYLLALTLLMLLTLEIANKKTKNTCL